MEKVQEVHLREEEPSEEMRTQSTDEQDAKSGLEEVRTAEEVQVSSEGEMRDAGRTRPAVKAQEKGMEAKKKTDAKEDRAAKEQGNVRRRSGPKWRLTWRQVPHTSRPRRTLEKKEKKRCDHPAPLRRAPQQGHYHVRFCLPIQVPCSLRYSSWAVEGSRFRRAPDPSCSYFTVANVCINNE